MIKSFSNPLTEKIFYGEDLNKKERKQVGALNIIKAQARLALIDKSSEKELMLVNGANYHSLTGTNRYSIDADARNSKWRITFSWEDEEMQDVELVMIQDTH